MAMALADLIRVGELRRLKLCAAPDCTAAVMDLSRNRSRIFCDTGNCGNRVHVAAYRERRAQASHSIVEKRRESSVSDVGDVAAGRCLGVSHSGRRDVIVCGPGGGGG
jgi:hypothetical protein